ncbi:iron(III) transport system permease protein [Comamonas sp. BIGb0124]|uniref:ABC transporter permease subunit n=1 Tax=Comamonas sp. BIGb0124 TaxID=2485130 RepID=UPI000F461DBB|nr:ABC transporter permease subunit [Comamonas sp. BIGb0124]ROR21578.1 iron(III) transport system permease protein [Comamonas sp. BIGb0124]
MNTAHPSPVASRLTHRGFSDGHRADRWLLYACLGLPLLVLVLFFGLPMLGIVWRSLLDDSTGTVGLANYRALLDSPGIWRAVRNSLVLGAATTGVSVLLGFMLAYALERTAMPGKRVIGVALSLPVLAPSLVLGLGLIFLLGRNGLAAKLMGTRPDIYGFWGLLLADALYTLPAAVLIIRAALRHSDARPYEAAEILGAGAWRQFLDITLPGVRYGLLSAAFVVFTLTLTDFGNAVVVGGDFPVLATEIYNQVSGQMKFGMGAVVGLLLLCPAALAVWIERMASRRQAGLRRDGSGASPLPRRRAWLDYPLLAGCSLVGLCIALVILSVVAASFMRLWPYRFAFTLRHYDIDLAGGYASLWTSVWISALAALIGTALLFGLSLGVRRLPGRLAETAHLIASMPVAVPGLVLGLSYVFFFNTPSFPWGMLYGTALLIAICNFTHFSTQGYAAMTTGMRHVPTALEDAVTVLGGGLGASLRDVYRPAMGRTLLAIVLFLFMNAMVTLSAVIFLVTPDVPLAAVTVMRLDEAGFTSQAAAFSTCIMAIVATIALLLHVLARPRARSLHARR